MLSCKYWLQKLHSIKSLGFTLIELLICICIIGLLASILLFYLDPAEMIHRTNDAQEKEIAAQLSQVFKQYNALHGGAWPWDLKAQGGSDCNAQTPPMGTDFGANDFLSCIAAVQAEGDALGLQKTGSVSFSPTPYATGAWIIGYTGAFNDAIISGFFITQTADNRVTICFQPTSKQEKGEANDTNTGANTCNNKTTACYLCTPPQ